jgi:hypothetical protein
MIQAKSASSERSHFSIKGRAGAAAAATLQQYPSA